MEATAMIEEGKEEVEKLLMAACFVTNFGTPTALSLLFAQTTLWLLALVPLNPNSRHPNIRLKH
jgi:hypothetical protein